MMQAPWSYGTLSMDQTTLDLGKTELYTGACGGRSKLHKLLKPLAS